MANFVLLVDAVASRRAAFNRDAAARIALLPGLTKGGVSSGSFSALWAAGARAPVLAQSDDRGAAVLWGTALDDDGAPVDLRALGAAWAAVGAMPAPYDGYHATAVYSPDAGLRLGADLIGMFPVYWWADDGVLLAGSSPELFRLHPAFQSRLDRNGLTAVLLTSYSIGGRTLQVGVRRLAPGHVLVAPPGVRPEEKEQYRLPLSDSHYDLPFSAQVELLHETLRDSVRRHVPTDQPCTLSLSGGRDSRLLAGLLVGQGSAVTALTFGEPHDTELKYASAVARAMAFEQCTLPLAVDPQGTAAEQQATWMHCATDFGALNHWGAAERLGNVPSRLVTGYAMDSIAGGSHIGWAYDTARRRMSFEAFFARINAYGIAEPILRRMLGGANTRDLVDEVKTTIHNVYVSYSGLEWQRAWCFDILHRQRLHVGNAPWLLSFGAWPVQPAVDRRVLGVAGGLPAAALAERRAQDEIVRRFYPRLAELPLDRNNANTDPLSPRLRHLLRQHIRQRLRPMVSLIPGRRGAGVRPRFFERVYDFNGPGWLAVRRLAEPYRSRLDGLLDRAVLDEYLPPPDRPLQVRSGIVDASGRKILLGLMLWARDHM